MQEWARRPLAHFIQMKFDLLVAQIKSEARIATDSTFDTTVVALLNELFKEAVEQQRPFELRAEATLALTTNTGSVNLPTDFFIHHQVRFVDADTSRTYPLTDEDKAVPPAPIGLYGHPKSFEILANSVLDLKPYSAIVTGDGIFLVYYKIPPIVLITALNVENPIPRLEPFLIRGVIRRIRMLHSDDVQIAQMLSGDVQSAASGYAKDEPREKER